MPGEASWAPPHQLPGAIQSCHPSFLPWYTHHFWSRPCLSPAKCAVDICSISCPSCRKYVGGCFWGASFLAPHLDSFRSVTWSSPAWSAGAVLPVLTIPASIISVLTRPVHGRMPPVTEKVLTPQGGSSQGEAGSWAHPSPISWHSFHMPQAPAADGERGVSPSREKTLLDKVHLKSSLFPFASISVGFVRGQENGEFPRLW